MPSKEVDEWRSETTEGSVYAFERRIVISNSDSTRHRLKPRKHHRFALAGCTCFDSICYLLSCLAVYVEQYV